LKRLGEGNKLKELGLMEIKHILIKKSELEVFRIQKFPRCEEFESVRVLSGL